MECERGKSRDGGTITVTELEGHNRIRREMERERSKSQEGGTIIATDKEGRVTLDSGWLAPPFPRESRTGRIQGYPRVMVDGGECRIGCRQKLRQEQGRYRKPRGSRWRRSVRSGTDIFGWTE